MTEKLTKLEINCETGEQIVSELTQEELQKIEENQKIYTEQQAKLEAEAQAKANALASALAKLAALGLSEEEAKALAGN